MAGVDCRSSMPIIHVHNEACKRSQQISSDVFRVGGCFVFGFYHPFKFDGLMLFTIDEIPDGDHAVTDFTIDTLSSPTFARKQLD